MTDIEKITTMQEAIEHYGKSAQVDMAIEEMSELTKALLKERRYGMDDIREHDIIDEIADVSILIGQLMLIFDNADEVNDRITIKLEHLRILLEDKANETKAK